MGRKGGKYCMSGERLTGELVDPFIWTGGGGDTRYVQEEKGFLGHQRVRKENVEWGIRMERGLW